MKKKQSAQPAQPKPRLDLNVVQLSTVKKEPVTWLWNSYLPANKITVLDGDPSVGKTYLALAIAASVTTGKLLPEYGAPTPKRAPASVLFLTGEDTLPDVILPRFEKLRGDPERFFSIAGLIHRQEHGEDLEYAITMEHTVHLEKAIRDHQAKLLICDPFSAFVGARVNFHRDNEMRPILAKLSKLAESYGCAILLLRHLNKTTAQAQYRGMGTIAISASARSILLAAKDPREEELNFEPGVIPDTSRTSRNIIVHAKCSVTALSSSFSYKIDDHGLKFSDTVQLTADEVLYPSKVKPPRQTATDFLQEFLSAGAKPVTEIRKAGAKLNFSEKTLERAAKDLGIVKQPISLGGQWYWATTLDDLAEVKAKKKESVN